MNKKKCTNYSTFGLLGNKILFSLLSEDMDLISNRFSCLKFYSGHLEENVSYLLSAYVVVYV